MGGAANPASIKNRSNPAISSANCDSIAATKNKPMDAPSPMASGFFFAFVKMPTTIPRIHEANADMERDANNINIFNAYLISILCAFMEGIVMLAPKTDSYVLRPSNVPQIVMISPSSTLSAPRLEPVTYIVSL